MSTDLSCHLQRLIKEGETAQVEFKQQFTRPERMAREIGALANTAGGWLILGVSDQGEILGVTERELIQTQLEQTCLHYLEPPVLAQVWEVILQRQLLIALHIPNSPDKPHQVAGEGDHDGQVYLRHQSCTVPASDEMIKVLMNRDESQWEPIPLDKLEQAVVDYLLQQGQITLKQYCRWVNISERRGSRILVKLLQAGVLNLFQQQRQDHYGLNPLWIQRAGLRLPSPDQF